jgi:hypothetical protein
MMEFRKRRQGSALLETEVADKYRYELDFRFILSKLDPLEYVRRGDGYVDVVARKRISQVFH